MFLKNDRGIPAKAIASDLDKGHTTLLNELSGQNGSKLGLADVFKGMALVGDVRPLAFMASYFGMILLPVAHAPDGHDMDEECLQGFQAVARFIEEAKGGADFEGLHAYLAEAIKELEDVWVRRRDESFKDREGTS
jgi:hypothetical protein